VIFTGNRFVTEYVYIFDQNNIPHFVQNYYGADLSGSYRSNIYLENKSYCVHDLFLTDEVETEGEFLPHVREKEWREFLPIGPSENASTIIAEAGLADISISKLVFIYMKSSSSCILEYAGFVSSVEGVQYFDQDFWEQALSFAKAKTGSVAEQEGMIADWITEQVRNRNAGGQFATS
jgi:hypothetical protein